MLHPGRISQSRLAGRHDHIGGGHDLAPKDQRLRRQPVAHRVGPDRDLVAGGLHPNATPAAEAHGEHLRDGERRAHPAHLDKVGRFACESGREEGADIGRRAADIHDQHLGVRGGAAAARLVEARQIRRAGQTVGRPAGKGLDGSFGGRGCTGQRAVILRQVQGAVELEILHGLTERPDGLAGQGQDGGIEDRGILSLEESNAADVGGADHRQPWVVLQHDVPTGLLVGALVVEG